MNEPMIAPDPDPPTVRMECYNIKDWLFEFEVAWVEHYVMISSPSGDTIRLEFSTEDDELFMPPVGWMESAVRDAEKNMRGDR